MRYVASYLLAALGGNSSPSAKDIKKILDSVGIEADDDRLNKVAALQGPEDPADPLLRIRGSLSYPTQGSRLPRVWWEAFASPCGFGTALMYRYSPNEEKMEMKSSPR